MKIETNGSRHADFEQDNERFPRLVGPVGAAGEFRRRFRNTLALLRRVIHRSAKTERDLPEYAAHLEDRLDAIVRAQAMADQGGEISLKAVLAEELFQYRAFEEERLTISGPDILLQPKAGLFLALAIHELAINAVEHGTLGSNEGRVDVSWSVVAGMKDQIVTLVWTETGVVPDVDCTRAGFGTEVLTRMFFDEMKAETEFAFGIDGLRYSASFALPDSVGRAGLSQGPSCPGPPTVRPSRRLTSGPRAIKAAAWRLPGWA